MLDEHYPTVIPPCPSWCALPAGHEYNSFMGGVEPENIDFTRSHVSSTGERPHASVGQFEHQNVRGAVTLDEPTIYLSVEADLTAEQAEEYAADLLAAAALLRQVSGADA